MSYTKPRGTEDWIAPQSENYRSLVDLLILIASLNGFHEIQTPIFESRELFVRSVGKTSDIVTKEFYDFKDKSGRDLVLRPEGTAGVIRAVVEEKLINKLPAPLKLCYTGPMFRYERPQSGRLRQFHQFGVECINSNSIFDDIDVFLFAHSIIQTIGIQKYEICINNIGNFKSRELWIDALKNHFKGHEKELSELSQTRLATNPLRILDDKEDGKKPCVLNAPKIGQFLSDDEKRDFAIICDCLTTLNIKYKVDDTLVRGLDYYTNFVFEINSTDDRLSGQPTLIGGGRYNNLVKEIGGAECGCVGFATGIERLLLSLEYEKKTLQEPKTIDAVVANLSSTTLMASVMVLAVLRSKGVSAVCKFDIFKLPKHFNYAESQKAKYVIILGEKELKENKLIIKNQKTLKQETITIDDVVSYIKAGH